MFDPELYVGQVKKRIHSCRGATINYFLGPLVSPSSAETSWDRWETIHWRARIEWVANKEILDVVDSWSRKRRSQIMHDFRYQFMEASGACIFRVDTHGDEIPYEETCHIHLGSDDDEAFEEGDPRIKGLKLSEIDFLKAFGWVHKYLKHDKKMPWE